MYVFTHIPIFIHKKWCKINILYVEGKDISDSLTNITEDVISCNLIQENIQLFFSLTI